MEWVSLRGRSPFSKALVKKEKTRGNYSTPRSLRTLAKIKDWGDKAFAAGKSKVEKEKAQVKSKDKLKLKTKTKPKSK